MNSFNRTYVILLLFIASFLYSFVGAQVNEGYAEKTFLNTDRDVYLTGETVWFSAFVSAPDKAFSNPLSRVLYIDLYNADKKVIIKQKLPLKDGEAKGNFRLSKGIASGRYYFRAYTNYQKNYLPQDITYREILVINPLAPIRETAVTGDVRILFKGGSAVQETLTEGVVLFPNRNFHYKNTYITNLQGEIIDSLIKVNPVMAYFRFTPEADEQYFLSYTDQAGSIKQHSIHSIQNGGYMLEAERHSDNLKVSIKRIGQLPENEIRLRIVNEYLNPISSRIVELMPGTNHFELLNCASDRISYYFLLLDKTDSILAFRHLPEKSLENPLWLDLNKTSFTRGDEIDLSVNLNKADIDPVWMTVSVFLNESYSINYNLPEGICAKMRSIVHENSILADQHALAGLINTNQEILVSALPEIRDVSVSGLVVDRVSREVIQDCRVYTSLLGPKPQFHTSVTNDKGEFIISLNHYYGAHKVFAGTEKAFQDRAEILVQYDFLEPYVPLTNTLFFSEKEHAWYEKMYRNSQLLERFTIEQSIKDSTFLLSQPLFSEPDISIYPDDFIELGSVEEIFHEIVPHTILRSKRDSFYFLIKNPNTELFIEDPMVMVDYVPVPSVNSILNLPPASIKRIDVIYQAYHIGSHTINGFIHIISKENQLELFKFPASTAFFDYETFSPQETFSAYQSGKVPLNYPMFLNLLYFGTSDEDTGAKRILIPGVNAVGQYTIRIQGLSKSGQPFKMDGNFNVTR